MVWYPRATKTVLATIAACLVLKFLVSQEHVKDDSDVEVAEISVEEKEGDGHEEEGDTCKEVMEERIQRLEEVCKQQFPELTGKIPDPKFWQVNSVHSAALCAPHKVGSESWRYFFEKLGERDRNSTEWRPATIEEWPEEGVKDKFIMAYQVRHPLERLLSSYRFVFERTDLHRSNNLNRRLLLKYGNYSEKEEKNIEFRKRATFRDFATFVAFGERDFPGEMDIIEGGAYSHWAPFHVQCNPCHPDFRPDFLLHMDTLVNDTLCFLESVPGIVDSDYNNLYHVNASPKGHSSKKDLQIEFYGQLNREILEGIYKRYKPDFELHGYELGDFLAYVNQKGVHEKSEKKKKKKDPSLWSQYLSNRPD